MALHSLSSRLWAAQQALPTQSLERYNLPSCYGTWCPGILTPRRRHSHLHMLTYTCPPDLHIPQCPDLSICPSCLLYTCLCLSMCSMWLYAYFVCAFLSDLGCPENSFTTELSMEQGKHVWGTHAFLVPWFLHTLLECASSWLTSWWQ